MTILFASDLPDPRPRAVAADSHRAVTGGAAARLLLFDVLGEFRPDDGPARRSLAVLTPGSGSLVLGDFPERTAAQPPAAPSRAVGAPGLPQWVSALAAAVALVVVGPVLALAGLAVALSSRGGVIFRQQRVGIHGEPFTFFKLRTMTAGSRGPRITAADDPRITPVGRVLRWTKIDELLSLWNVVRGDMALVGPRPEVSEYVDLDDAGWRAVLSVRPGITDPVTLLLFNEEALLATVTDRDSFYRRCLLPFKQRGYMHYIRTRTPWVDLKTLLDTVKIALRPGARSTTHSEAALREWLTSQAG